MRVAICDDEQVQCQLVTKELQIWSKEQSVTMEVVPFSDAESFLFHWEDDKKYDLLILDIEMGKMNGMELAKKLREDEISIPILFITGYESYMSQGYDVEALHYLMKPIKREKLFEVLNRVKNLVKAEDKILFQVEDGQISLVPSEIWMIEAMVHRSVFQISDGTSDICPSEIWMIEAMVHRSVLYTQKEKYIIKTSFHEVMKKLEMEKGIILVHRSFLINLKHVASITRNELILDNGMKAPLSRGKAKEVNAAFIQYYH